LRVLTSLTASCIVAMFTSVALAEETGDLKINFVHGGKAFKPKPINVNKDVGFCGKNGLVDERLLINDKNMGIKNVIVYVYTGRGGSKLAKVDPANNTHTLANQNCRFEPHIVIAQTGDKLKVTNPDPVGHNANMNFFNNKAENLMIPSGKDQLIELKKAEPAPIPIDCNIHPWMKSYVVVLEHPFAAVSDENGDLMIKGLPTGKKLTFRIFHEAGAIKEVDIEGKKEEWKRSRFEIKIKPGLNDLGTVTVPASALK
jgi:plastocyanin